MLLCTFSHSIVPFFNTMYLKKNGTIENIETSTLLGFSNIAT